MEASQQGRKLPFRIEVLDPDRDNRPTVALVLRREPDRVLVALPLFRRAWVRQGKVLAMIDSKLSAEDV